MATDYYHGSNNPLPVGTVLESRFPPQHADQQYQIVLSALKDGLPVVKALLLVERAMKPAEPVPMFPIVFKEIVFELNRPRDKPSRIHRSSVFLFPDRDDLARFQGALNEYEHSYLCTLKGDPETFTGDLLWVSSLEVLPPIQEQFDKLTESAVRYWAGEAKSDQPVWEILAPSGSVTITAEI